MGEATLWLAIKGIPRAAVLNRLNLQAATEPDPTIWGAELPDGWYLLVNGGFGMSFLDDATMNRACADCFAVSCYCESHVMVSSAAGWEKGRRVWSVLHQGEEAIDHLVTDGELPSAFAPLSASLTAKQKEQGDRPRCDYIYNIPVELAAAITGFDNNRGTSAGYPDLEPLELAVIPTLPKEYWLQPSRPESWFTPFFG